MKRKNKNDMKNLFENNGEIVFHVVSNIELPVKVSDFNEVYFNYICDFDFQASRIIVLYNESNHHVTLGVVVVTNSDEVIAKWLDCHGDYFYSDMLKNGFNKIDFEHKEWTKIDVYTEIICGMSPHENYCLPDGFVNLFNDYVIN